MVKLVEESGFIVRLGRIERAAALIADNPPGIAQKRAAWLGLMKETRDQGFLLHRDQVLAKRRDGVVVEDTRLNAVPGTKVFAGTAEVPHWERFLMRVIDDLNTTIDSLEPTPPDFDWDKLM